MLLNNNIYQVNWQKLARWLVPARLRLKKMMAFISALVTPINDIHNRLLLFRADVAYRMNITPQVFSLEKALNDRYDIEARRIRIVDGIRYDPVVLFQKVENKPIKLFRKSEGTKQVLYTKAETGIFTVNFIILIPVQVAFDLAELTAFVNKYKLPSKKFKVQIV